MSDVSGFSEQKVEDRFKGRVDRVKMVLTIFIEDNSSIVDVIDDAISSDSHDDLRLYFHKIKGSALSIEAESLAGVSARLEHDSANSKAIDQGDYALFKNCLVATMDQAKEYCAR